MLWASFNEACLRYSIKEIDELYIIEVQTGKDISEEDIERFEWDWEKIIQSFYTRIWMSAGQ